MSRTNAKASLENAFASFLQAEFASNPTFSVVNFYSAQRSGEKQMPAVVVSCPSIEAVAHQAAVYEGQVNIAVISPIDEDGAPEVAGYTVDPKHLARVTELESTLDEDVQVAALINAGGYGVKIYGYILGSSGREIEGRAFADIVTLHVAFQPIV